MKKNKITNEQLLKDFDRVRFQTLMIVEPLEIEDYVIQTAFYMSPPRWHLGHVSWLYDQLLRQHDKGHQAYSENYDHYLNSYYLTFGEPFDKGKRGMVSRPTVEETKEYYSWISQQVKKYIRGTQSLTDEITYLFYMANNHEYQHQELMVYDVQHLLQDRYHPIKLKTIPSTDRKHSTLTNKMIKIPGGIFKLGLDVQKRDIPFWYDIEAPLHKTYVHDYYIDAIPVTNGDYLQFIDDGGYDNFRFWLSDGWEVVRREKWQAPLYWEKDENDEWTKSDLRGKVKISDISDEPVLNVSYYEAWAFARWAGKRLPTEAEWEKAASWDEDAGVKRLFPWGDNMPDDTTANLFESLLWGPAPVGSYEKGKSYYGCYQMVSDVWEWTSSEFMPYPGFKSGFAEYNDKWFGNQKVLRGGSFATSREQTRNTYRNFFRCPERWMFAGFRCVKDI
jgi:ergothioneine biosynthesis protein EgtB